MRRKQPIIFACSLALAVGILYGLTQSQGTIKAADARYFNPERIIADFVFRNDESMTTTQIQRFLENKDSACLKNKYVLSLHDTDKDGIGDEPYGLGENNKVRVSTLIKQASKIYNISPRVILATLEKEQGLVTRQDCPTWRYNTALGYGCPDSAPCDNSAYGFTRQIDYGTWHFKGFYEDSYPVPPTVPGSKFIQYNPSSSCGGKTINIRNRATAALYSYTPYQPNSAALAAAPGQTVHCGAYGNLNFWRYFTDWFGSTQSNVVFKAMKTPRWMEIQQDTKKVDPYTGELVSDMLPAGTRVYFEDVINVHNKTYLRTSHDSKYNNDKGILLDRLKEISLEYVSMKTPRWMRVPEDLYKIDPRTRQKVGDIIPAGKKLYFPTLTEINDTLYLRTEADTQNGVKAGIPLVSLDETSVTYGVFKQPRWLVATRETQEYDLRYPSGSTSATIPIGAKRYLDHSTSLNGHRYATEGMPPAGTYTGINLDYLRNVSHADFGSLKHQRAYRLSETTPKTDLSTGQPEGSIIAAGTPVYFQSLVKLGDASYLRSAHDTSQRLTTVIPLDKVTPIDVTFQDMKDPRRLRIKTAVRKVDPVTLQRLDGVLYKGTSATFSQSIVIEGQLYLRTTYDTKHGHYKVIPFYALREL